MEGQKEKTEQARTPSRAGTGSGSSPRYTPEESQFSSVAQSCPTLRPHGLQHARPPCPSPAQTHVHVVSDAVQPSHPLSATSSFSGLGEDERNGAGETLRVSSSLKTQK